MAVELGRELVVFFDVSFQVRVLQEGIQKLSKELVVRRIGIKGETLLSVVSCWRKKLLQK